MDKASSTHSQGAQIEKALTQAKNERSWLLSMGEPGDGSLSAMRESMEAKAFPVTIVNVMELDEEAQKVLKMAVDNPYRTSVIANVIPGASREAIQSWADALGLIANKGRFASMICKEPLIGYDLGAAIALSPSIPAEIKSLSAALSGRRNASIEIEDKQKTSPGRGS